MKRDRWKTIFSLNPRSITLLSLLLILALFILGVPILDIVELKTYDLRFRSRGLIQPAHQVVAAVIDEKSLDREGRWPWPRAKIGRIMDILDQDGAKVIAFDIGFLEPDENNNLHLIRNIDRELQALGIENPELKQFMEEQRRLADNDLILARSIDRAQAKTILGYFFYMRKAFIQYGLDEKDIEDRLQTIAGSKYPVIIYTQNHMPFEPFRTAYAPVPNLPLLHQAADSSGYFNVEPDPEDGIVRTIPLMYKCGQEVYAPLSVQAVWHYLDRPQMMIRVADYGIQGLQFGDRKVPTDEMGYMRINFLGPEKTFPHYPLSDILKEDFPMGTFKDKIVIVGATAIGLGDIRNTPFSSTGEYPGLEIHATVMENILQGNHVSKPRWSTVFDVMAILLLGLMTGFAIPRLNAVKAVMAAVALLILYFLVNRWLFVQNGLWLNLVYPLIAVVLIYTSLTVYHYLTEERERKKIRGAFSYYVSRSVVNEMLKDPDKLRLGGEKNTSISEGMSPEDLVHLLNEYLTVMTDIVFRYEGTLDKYIGDALMAIYGAPLDQSDHPRRACASALDMMEGLKALNDKWIREGRMPLDIGIGINTGFMMVGNMGSDQRFDYTVMGDAVNLGSRLEGANKSYRTHILISGSTYERVKDDFVCMELDRVRVKGKKEPVGIFELISRKELPCRDMDAIARFHQGLRLYKNQDWEGAIEVFESVNAMDQTLYAARLYIERCEELKKAPPGPGWDGVFTMTTK